MSDLIQILTALLLMSNTMCFVQAEDQRSDIVERGHQVLEEFYERYSSYEVDLVFVLDRSASVLAEGWGAMLAFVRSILQHFTVDKDNTRVAIVTYSTVPSVEVNDLGETLEDKCSLMRRIKQKLTRRQLSGFTATHDALVTVRHLLYPSRRQAKKAVFVLTDGRSNIGLPPVRASVELRSLQWNSTWNVSAGGPQLEIYAFGIQNADSSELASIASPLPNHTYHLPNFRAFRRLARALHQDKQRERWKQLPDKVRCHLGCSEHALCACGTRSGDYHCVCQEGYHGDGISCQACPVGFYKQGLSPGRCRRCPDNSVTRSSGAGNSDQCLCKAPYHQEGPGTPCQLHHCEELPSIRHGRKFHVRGRIRDERPDSGSPCDNSPENSCHYRCDKGYRLSGHPGLICQPNGTWRGQIPSCQEIDCRTLADHHQEVDHGTVTYDSGRTTYGSSVTVTCDRGWRAVGDTARVCTRHGMWSGTATSCVESKCPPLPPISQGQITPEECSQDRQMPGQVCEYSCRHGYQIHGPASQTCDLFGRWTMALNTSCVDIDPPHINCPEDIRVPITEGNFTFVHWDDQSPKVTDNSGVVTVKPTTWRDNPAKMVAGYHQIEYTATDGTGNQAYCTLAILVVERTVRNTFCPSNITRVDVAGFETTVTWKPPMFLDNNDDGVEFHCNRQSGTLFSMATHSVYCEPLMRGQTAHCRFYISLQRRECDHPPGPRHGSLVCTATSTLLKHCVVLCDDQYDFYDYPQQVYNCDLNGQWKLNDGQFWPDCSDQHFPGMALMQSEYEYYYYHGDCEGLRQEIVQKFLMKVESAAQRMCSQVTCSVGDVTVTCGKSSRKRREMHTDDDERSRLKRQVGSSGGDNSDQEFSERRILIVRFSVNASAYQYNLSFRGQKLIKRTLHKLAVMLGRNLGQENLTVADPSMNSSVEMYLDHRPSYTQQFEACGRGFVAQSYNSVFVSCVACPAGMFHLEGNATCESCPLGSYQDVEGSVDCLPCPGDTKTLTSQANSITKCLEPCRRGYRSPSGLEPCTPCGVGSYQEIRGQTSCTDCPESRTNIPGYQDSLEGCRERCEPGTYNSSYGLRPCLSCPRGTFQPDPGSIGCNLCPNNMTTLIPGAHDIDLCQAINFCENVTNDTCYHGECVSLLDDFLCDCYLGYAGATCHEEVNECASDPCIHNATCDDLVNGFRCVCPITHTGERCEARVSLCGPDRCDNGGSCVDTDHGYYCYCPYTYTGIHCESRLPCASQPCDHGDCRAINVTYICDCHVGFTGVHCDQTDHCVSEPCTNGVTCVSDVRGHVCICGSEFTGHRCETRLNETCHGIVCQNGGLCRITERRPSCRCGAGYGGQHCEQVISPDFDLVFDPLGTPGSVLLRLDSTSLTALTTCVWLRTADMMNYGTPFSYAVETNGLTWGEDNMFTLTDYGQFKFYVHGEVAMTTVAVNDGRWQHVCVAWQSSGGLWWLYVNGTVVHRGDNLAVGQTIPGDGYLVLGQEQDSFGDTFSSSEAFIGEMSQFNVFDWVLDEEHIKKLANQNTCNKTYGNVVAWTEVVDRIHGNTRVRLDSHCLDINECLSRRSNNCTQHRKCTDLIGGFVCTDCRYGYQGDRCDEPMNKCLLGVCQNEAACVDGPLSQDFRCHCRPGYTGMHCEVVVRICDLNPCAANTSCVEGSDGGHTCLCPPGDSHCDPTPRTCFHGYCQNNGVCSLTTVNKPKCICPPGFQGQYCEVKVTGCHGDSCWNGGTCSRTTDGFTCRCTNSWKGDNCAIAFVPDCDMVPCLNNGTCVVSPEEDVGYECVCAALPGVTWGRNCELNPCESSPCQNSGTCVLLPDSSYTCVCPVNVTGQLCEGDSLGLDTGQWTNTENVTTVSMTTEVRWMETVAPTTHTGTDNMCVTFVCDNGGTCISQDGQGHCICVRDFTGRNCGTHEQRVTKTYRATILVRKPYHAFYRQGRLFRHNFTKEVRLLYSGMMTGEDRVQTTNIYIRPSSHANQMLVTFTLLYAKFVDSEGPVLSITQLRRILEDSLRSGYLGSLPVSHRNFSFTDLSQGERSGLNEGSDPGKDAVAYLVAGIIFLLLSLIFLTVFMGVRLRKVAYNRTSKLMQRMRLNNANNMSLQLLSNPVFEDVADRQLSDNMYAELSDSVIDPYCVGTKSEVRRGSSAYSSKRSNLEREAARKTSELSDTTSDCSKKFGAHYDSVFSDGDSYISPIHNKNQFVYANTKEKNDTKNLLPASGKYDKYSDSLTSDHDMESGGFELVNESFDKEDGQSKDGVESDSRGDKPQTSPGSPAIPSYANIGTEKFSDSSMDTTVQTTRSGTEVDTAAKRDNSSSSPVSHKGNNYVNTGVTVQTVSFGTSPASPMESACKGDNSISTGISVQTMSSGTSPALPMEIKGYNSTLENIGSGTSAKIFGRNQMDASSTSADIHTYINAVETKTNSPGLDTTYCIPRQQKHATSKPNSDDKPRSEKKKVNTSIMRTESASQTDYVDMTNGLVLDKVVRWRRKRLGETTTKKPCEDEDYNYIEPNHPLLESIKQGSSKICRKDSASQTDYMDMNGGKLLSQFGGRKPTTGEAEREFVRRKSMHDYLEVLPVECKDEKDHTSTLPRPVKPSVLSSSVSTSTLPRRIKKSVLSGSVSNSTLSQWRPKLTGAVSMSTLSRVGRKDMSKRELPPLPRHAEV